MSTTNNQANQRNNQQQQQNDNRGQQQGSNQKILANKTQITTNNANRFELFFDAVNHLGR